jgi:outer membrane protein
MKTIYKARFLLTICFLLFSSESFSGDLKKIGIVNIKAAVFSTKLSLSISKDLSSKLKKDTDSLKSMEEKISQAQNKLVKNKDTMSPDNYKNMLKEAQTLVAKYQQKKGMLMQIKSSTEEKVLLSYRSKLQSSIDKLVKKKRITLLLDSSAVVYINKKMSKNDITKDLIKELNRLDKIDKSLVKKK